MTLTRVPFLRVVRSQGAWAAVFGWSAVALASAWMQRHSSAIHGADRALDLYAMFALPLLVYALVGAALDGSSLARSGRPLVRLGAPPERVALATVAASVLVSAIVAGALGAAVAFWAHGAGDPPRGADALHVASATALAGGAYAAYLMIGAAFIGGPWGRGLLLCLDWGLGTGVGLGAVFVPRAHLRSLLGGEAPLDLQPVESTAALAVLLVVCAGVAVWRARRARG